MKRKNLYILLFSIIICIVLIVLAVICINILLKEQKPSYESETNIGHEVGVLIIHDDDTEHIADILHHKLGGEKITIRDEIADHDAHNYIFIGTGENTNKNIDHIYELMEPFDVEGKYVMPYGTDDATDYDVLYTENIQNAQIIPAFEFFDDFDASEIEGLVNGWIDTVFSWGWND